MKKVLISAVVAGAALVSSCSSDQQQGTVTMGNSSKLDSLSYALGANVGYMITYQMSDIPFDYDAISKGIEESAFDKSSVTSAEALETLQAYFMTERAERAAIVAKKRAEADSIDFANGVDSAVVLERRASVKADAEMFASEAQREEVSYAFGVDLGSNIVSADIPVQIHWLGKAMSDISAGDSKMSEEEAMAYLQNYFTVVRPAEMQKISAENLAEIEKMAGVQKTSTGLLYRVEVEGDSNVIAKKDEDTVKVNYTGRLVRNNNVFDTSRFADRSEEQKTAMAAQGAEGYDQDAPIEFALNRVIPGWTEGMKLVGKGGRISLWIPAELAYGERGAGNDIGPNEALFFDVEVLDVIPFEEAAATAE